MQIDLSELFAADGISRTYEVPVEMEVFSCAEGDYPICKKEKVCLEARHTGKRCVEIQGKIRASLEIPCSRCLKPVEVPVAVSVEKKLDLNSGAETSSDEAYYLSGYYLDVDKLVYGELIVNLPMKVLCSPDCKGICMQCGKNLNEGPCSCAEGPGDPRMAAIRDIFNHYKEV